MTQTTTSHTNTSWRAHPAVVHAALRSRIAVNRRHQENHYLDAAALAVKAHITVSGLVFCPSGKEKDKT